MSADGYVRLHTKVPNWDEVRQLAFSNEWSIADVVRVGIELVRRDLVGDPDGLEDLVLKLRAQVDGRTLRHTRGGGK